VKHQAAALQKQNLHFNSSCSVYILGTFICFTALTLMAGVRVLLHAGVLVLDLQAHMQQ
jgi:hypothetical protein